MTEQLRILICDNDIVRVNDWRNRIDSLLGEGIANIEAMTPAEFAQTVKALNARVLAAKSKSIDSRSDQAGRFDEADILILDSDLTPDPDSDSGEDPNGDVATYLNGEVGEHVARLARSHTTVGAIVVVNQAVRRRTFDLTMTRWSTGAAEVYITHDDIDSPGLWFGRSNAGCFRPWHWPALSKLPAIVSARLGSLDLQSKVLVELGLITDGRTQVSYRQIEALMADTKDPLELTFKDVALSSTFGLGLQPKETASEPQLLHLAAWGVRRWIDRVVLPTQTVLTDFPHLLQDRPWLSERREDLDAWNSDSRIWRAPSASSVFPEAYNSSVSLLLGRDVWNTRRLPPLGGDERVLASDPVFCEDTSTFVSSDDATDFESDLEGSFSTRFVKQLDGIDYAPRHRLFR